MGIREKSLALCLAALLLTGCCSKVPESENGQVLSRSQPELQYEEAMETARQGRYMEAMLQFAALGDWEDAKIQYLDSGYRYAQQQLSLGNELEAIAFFAFVRDYQDADDQIRNAKCAYVRNHQIVDDPNTQAFLLEKDIREDPEMDELYHDLYDWKILIDSVNDSEDSTETMDTISKFSRWYIHFSVSGGFPNDTTDITVKAVYPSGFTDQVLFEEIASGAKDLWVYFSYSHPDKGSSGPLRVGFFDGEDNLLKIISIQITE